jgi:hypothetical protein
MFACGFPPHFPPPIVPPQTYLNHLSYLPPPGGKAAAPHSSAALILFAASVAPACDLFFFFFELIYFDLPLPKSSLLHEFYLAPPYFDLFLT